MVSYPLLLCTYHIFLSLRGLRYHSSSVLRQISPGSFLAGRFLIRHFCRYVRSMIGAYPLFFSLLLFGNVHSLDLRLYAKKQPDTMPTKRNNKRKASTAAVATDTNTSGASLIGAHVQKVCNCYFSFQQTQTYSLLGISPLLLLISLVSPVFPQPWMVLWESHFL